MTTTFILMLCAVLVGSVIQRATGIGFALICAPFIILHLGPVDGVVATSLLGGLSALLIYAGHAKHVEYRKIGPITLAAIVGIVPGALMMHFLPAPPMQIASGSLMVVALIISLFGSRMAWLDSGGGRIGAGLLGGLMQAVGGVGGPAVIAYSNASRWDHRKFATSVQFFFVVTAVAAVAMLWRWPAMSLLEWAEVLVALVAGTLAGNYLARYMGPRLGRTVSMILAFCGAIMVIVNGARALG
ncbi:sulfite exporter TauE/SafE family protein [Brevibacterium sp. 91QC2O2]|uniref:sulfite exporter TauE/SafE family protein n=1 Tax=Brevibacterium TaxID=1696 RepID=UPI00211C3B31|nr:sulfite exporter TauE/SafE family protein [Brevibacterium sp. 91QC2O2]MCQ9386782.1 sulfite exporter TauE/SafE family protein [Brevibacterium sp. 68QC2CO]